MSRKKGIVDLHQRVLGAAKQKVLLDARRPSEYYSCTLNCILMLPRLVFFSSVATLPESLKIVNSHFVLTWERC